MLPPLPSRTPPEEQFTYYESDLYALARVFFPDVDTVFVMDPHQRTVHNWDTDLVFVNARADLQQVGRRPVPYALINLSRLPIKAHPIDHGRLAAALSFFPSHRDEELLPYGRNYYAMANPYGGIRWIVPENLRHARFLSLYAEDVYHPMIYRGIVAAAARWGRWRWVTDVRFRLYRKDDTLLPRLKGIDHITYDSFALFSGRLNLHGRVLAALYDRNRISAFVKTAVQKGAAGALQHEYEVLRKLAAYSFERLVIPSTVRQGDDVIFQPIFPENARPLQELSPMFLAAWRSIQQPFDQMIEAEKWMEQTHWPATVETLTEQARRNDVPVGVSAQNVLRLLEQIKAAIDKSVGRVLRFSLTHGDFSGRNIHWDGRKVYAVDWERARWTAPAMSDFLAFHLEPFEARGVIDPDEVMPDLEAWMKDPEVQQVLDLDEQALRAHLLLSLIDRSLYYLSRLLPKRSIYHQINLRFYLWYQLFHRFMTNAEI